MIRPRESDASRYINQRGNMTVFEKRPLGRTAVAVTSLGLGCATLGGSRVAVSREEAEGIARAAWEA